jgi:hypothetical protein
MTTKDERRVEISVDPRLLSIVGKSLYKGHPIPILVRELVQNAVDAHLRDNSEPDIDIIFKIDSDNDVTEISVRDRGIGMSVDDLHNNFLRLGASDKGDVDDEAVGGFGIAKAAIMSHKFWSVHTRNNYIDYQMLLDHEVYSKRDLIKGTIVTITPKESWDWTAKKHTVIMLLLSELKGVNLILEYDDDTIDTVRHENIGIHYLDTVTVQEDWSNTAKEAMHKSVTMTVMQDAIFNLTKHFKIEIAAYSVVRIKGLVQFIDHSWGYRKTNLIFDLHSDELPDSVDYPLTISREEVKGELGKFISSEIKFNDINAITANNKIREPEPKDDRLVHGYYVSGVGEMAGTDMEQISQFSQSEMREAYAEIDEKLHDEDSYIGYFEARPAQLFVNDGELYGTLDNGNTVKLSAKRNTARYIAALQNTMDLMPEQFDQSVQDVIKASEKRYTKIATIIINYENTNKTLAIKHAKLLTVWEQILQLVADNDDYFGIGVIGTKWTNAERKIYENSVYYMINPENIFNSCDTNEGIVLRLWYLAVHETCHKDVSSHNEAFTTAMGHRIQATADRIYFNLRQLAEELS